MYFFCETFLPPASYCLQKNTSSRFCLSSSSVCKIFLHPASAQYLPTSACLCNKNPASCIRTVSSLLLVFLQLLQCPPNVLHPPRFTLILQSCPPSLQTRSRLPSGHLRRSRPSSSLLPPGQACRCGASKCPCLPRPLSSPWQAGVFCAACPSNETAPWISHHSSSHRMLLRCDRLRCVWGRRLLPGFTRTSSILSSFLLPPRRQCNVLQTPGLQADDNTRGASRTVNQE